MQHTMDCTANITAQDATYPTYKKVDCTLHTNANNDNFYGKLIDCTVAITTILVDAIGGLTTIGVDITIGDVDISTDTITVTIDIPTGTEIIFSSTDTLPAPLVAGTTYYTIRVDGTHIKVATTLINANAGTAIDLTDVGSGTHTSTVYEVSGRMIQSLRLVVTIDNIDISAALTGSLNIQHNKNMISTASLNLGNTTYSPRTNSHIDLEKVIVITAYINGQEKKLFTGLTDEPSAENTPAFRVIVTGRDYGKKLLDKKTTLVSVQDLADSTKRNDLIKYLAEQAGVTSVDIPEMDIVTIDNSFSHQSIWDMIQKEAMVELYWVKFSEDNVMHLKLDEIKSDTSLYPTPDWSYDEDRIIRLRYKRGRVNINKIIILGQTKQERIPHTTTTTTPEYIPGATTLFSDSLNYAEGEKIYYNANLNYTKTVGDFILKIHCYGSGGGGGNIHIHVGQKSQHIWEAYIITLKIGTVGGNATLVKTVDSCSTGGSIHLDGIMWVLSRGKGSLGGYPSNFDKGHKGGAFTFDITVEGYPRSDIVDETTVQDTTWETQYDQISALVTDPNSIAKYGERDGGSIEFPLLETEAQCKAVGSKIIRDSHRMGQQADFEIPFNPLIQTGQTIAIIDKKIGITERYYIESLSHNIDINEGKVRARTQIGGVYYT